MTEILAEAFTTSADPNCALNVLPERLFDVVAIDQLTMI